MKKGYKECPFCKNEIKKEAIKCMYCKEMLPEEPEVIKTPETKECPFCKNEIKYEAVKCQYCHEFLDGFQEKKNSKQEYNSAKKNKQVIEKKKVEIVDMDSVKPTTRWRRVDAGLYDFLIDITIVGAIYNVIAALVKGKTFGLNLCGIKYITNDGCELSFKQRLIRFGLYRPVNIVIFGVFGLLLSFISDTLMFIGLIPYYCTLLLNLIEIFCKTPSFVDKKMGLIEVQEKPASTGHIRWVLGIIFIMTVYEDNFSNSNVYIDSQQLFIYRLFVAIIVYIVLRFIVKGIKKLAKKNNE